MANHGFASWDTAQLEALVNACESLKRTVADTIQATVDQFRNTLVTTDAVLGDDPYKEEVAGGLIKTMDGLREDISIEDVFTKFETKVHQVEELINQTITRNKQNNEENQAILRNQAKQAGSNIGK